VPKVIALVDDLFFRARIAETAKHVGVELEAAANGDDLLARASNANGAGAALILVDLNSLAAPLDALQRLHAAGNQIPVVAFLSHVQTELAAAAHAAGCTEVMPRSKFTQDLAAILERAREAKKAG